jgi:uncharacterized membrane protein
MVLAFIPGLFVVANLLFGLLDVLIVLGLLAIWVFTVLKALKGDWFKLPFIGDFAERQARS